MLQCYVQLTARMITCLAQARITHRPTTKSLFKEGVSIHFVSQGEMNISNAHLFLKFYNMYDLVMPLDSALFVFSTCCT